MDLDASDPWVHADEEINIESSLGLTSHNSTNEIDGIFDLFCSCRTSEDSIEESAMGVLSDPGGSEFVANSSSIKMPSERIILRLHSIASYALINKKVKKFELA